MKSTFIGCISTLIAVTLLPVVLASGDSPALTCGTYRGDIEPILLTIRTLESGGNYTAHSAGSSASGAYQFLDSTWNGHGGYTRAADAPPHVQDAKAATHVTDILQRHANDVSAVPVVWYIGHVPDEDSPEWDAVPAPEAGNRLTPRQYQQRWLDEYQRRTSNTTTTSTAVDNGQATRTTPPPTVGAGCFGIGGAVTPLDGQWSLPGPIALIDANPTALTHPHHDYPAWDWIIPTGTPVYAVRGGTVTAYRTWPHNWWEQGCGANGGGSCDTCGVGLTITDDTGTRWTYCHGTQHTVTGGATVTAGQQILWSGNTGRSGTPHLHLEIRTTDNVQRCPQRLLVSLHQHQTGLDPKSLPVTGCHF